MADDVFSAILKLHVAPQNQGQAGENQSPSMATPDRGSTISVNNIDSIRTESDAVNNTSRLTVEYVRM